MPRTGENIYKRKDGRWEGRYIKGRDAAGKARYAYIYARSYGEIKARLIKAKNSAQSFSERTTSSCLFAEAADRWLENVRLNCKPSTYNKYMNSYKNHIEDVFGKYQISKINGENIDAFLRVLLEEKKLSHKTAQDICMIVKQIFNYAETNYGALPNFSFKRMKIKSEQSKAQTLSQKESQRLSNFLLKDTDEIKAGILLSLYTGIRLGELCALRWEDVSFENSTVKIFKTVQRIQTPQAYGPRTQLIISTPKTESSNRVIPLPKGIADILYCEKKPGDCYLLSGSESCPDPRTVEYDFKRILQKCDLPPVKFHALRHTFATECIELGVDAKTLSEILGHSSVNITLNRYVHTAFEQKRKAMNLLTLP